MKHRRRRRAPKKNGGLHSDEAALAMRQLLAKAEELELDRFRIYRRSNNRWVIRFAQQGQFGWGSHAVMSPEEVEPVLERVEVFQEAFKQLSEK